MTPFPLFLRSEVLRLGENNLQRGEAIAASAMGVSPRTVRNWHYETGAAPSAVEQAGARALLPLVAVGTKPAPYVRPKRRQRPPRPAPAQSAPR